MAAHRDPTRRNRNIGTAKQGHGRDNRDGLPRRWHGSGLQWDRGRPHTVVRRNIAGRSLPFLVEHTRADCVHACTVDDVAAMLELLPSWHVSASEWIPGLRGVVLRQPTHKEETHTPVWGRLGYFVDVDGDSGPVVFLEAQTVPMLADWGKSVNPSGRRELDRLVEMADTVERTRGGHTLGFDLAGVRRVQLDHTLAHELGHVADWVEKVHVPWMSEDDDDEARLDGLIDRYFQRPSVEREEFAHRYADDAMAELRRAGSAPFDRILDPDALMAEGLRLEDFVPAT